MSTNSANNAGIVTQAVSSTTLGHQAPFFESYDCIHEGRCSFMLIHTGFILYLTVPFYALLPSTLTLLVLQGIVVALAAVPLYWLTRQVTGSGGKALFAAGLFLVYAPAFSAFSLHLEALLPLELIGLAALWQAGRYRWGFLVALMAFLTIEAAPVFVFLIGAFFLLEGYHVVLKFLRTWRQLRKVGTGTSEGERYRADLSRIRSQLLGSKRLQATLLLMGLAVLAFVVLFSFRNVWGYQVLGVARPPVATGSGGLFYDGTGTTVGSVSSALSSTRFLPIVEFWLVMFGLVAFLPLLAPRSLVISLPWVAFTFLTNNLSYYTIGLEESVVIAGPIFIGVAYGLVRLPWGTAPISKTGTKSDAAAGESSKSARTWRSRKLAQAGRITVISVLAVVVAANVLLSPINPALPDLQVELGSPFVAGYFDHSLSITPGLIQAEKLVGEIPRSASVAADSPLFPLVANYPRAFVFLPKSVNEPFVNPPHLARLPFNVSKGPDFVLIELSELDTLETPFAQNLSNPSMYGLFGYVSSTAVGPLLLYEQGYSGMASRFGPALTALNESFAPRSGLVAGSGGHYVSNTSAPGGIEIKSKPKANSSNPVWKSNGVWLPPGAYTLDLEIFLNATNLSGNPMSKILEVVGSGFGPTVLNETFDASSFTAGVWSQFVFDFTVANPVPYFNFDGYLIDANATISIASMTIAPSGSD
ncbi:MAG: DUF2079 domain-containing protein [Thermoplasmata archaeon]